MHVPQGCRTAPLRARKGIDTTRICQNPARASYLVERGPCGPRTDPARTVHGLFMISKPERGPWTYNACIKTLRAPYGEAKFVRRRTGPVRAPWVDVRFLFKTAREQPVRGPGVWCDWGIMPRSHHTPGPRTDCSRTVLKKNRTSTHGARTDPMRCNTNFAFPYGAVEF